MAKTSATKSYESYIELRNKLLKDKEIEPKIIHKAWFTLSHMLLSENALVADIGCDEGALTYAMAVLYPQVKFIGIDIDKRKINKAKITYKLPNLEFKHADATEKFDENGTYDAIVNNYVLHEIFSASRYNEGIVTDTLRVHFEMLKKNGLMFIQDYARPPAEEFVLVEIPDKPSHGQDPSKLSEADLLVWYSEHARPRRDAGTGGFFLDELPERRPGTRLFRLPYKWAYEFIMRKDDRQHWDKELPIEYTFFTQSEFRKEIRNIGARVSYSAPHWDEEYIKENFDKNFRLMHDDGKTMAYPATSFVIAARKMADRKSLLIHERRPSHTEESKLTITAMRDNETGALVDVASREEQVSEVIPYRVDSETGRLKIYLHDDVPRSITNSVPRNGMSIDDRRWSGHMIEPIAISNEKIDFSEDYDPKTTKDFAKSYLGLKPEDGVSMKKGPEYFPAPDFIDDIVHTFYVEVEKHEGAINPKSSLIGADMYNEKGTIREVDAQQVLDAITVGKIPSARLELQILYLFNHLEIKSENWSQKQVAWKVGNIKSQTKLKKFLKNYQIEDKRFKKVKGTAGQLRPVHSIFVEEGQSKGSTLGLSSRDLDFVVHHENTINTAVILPLSKGMKQEVHAGFYVKQMPVPQRHTGDANIISAPSLNLPPHVQNQTQAKEYIADHFGVIPEMIIKMGESYFSHIGITQQKIHPYAVVVPDAYAEDDPEMMFMPFYQMKLLKKMIKKDTHFMIVMGRAYRYLHEDLRMDFERRVSAIVKERFEMAKPEWSLPLSFEPSPIRKEALPDQPAEPQQNLEASAQPKDVDKDKIKKEIEEAKAKANPGFDLMNEFEQEFEEFVETLEQTGPELNLDR